MAKTTSNEYKYFQERTDKRLESMEVKIDQLLEFKNISDGKVIGITLAGSAIVSLVISLVGIYFGTR